MARLLLCRPDYYGIEYEINPWMNRARAAHPALAAEQWERLRQNLEANGCQIELIPPEPGLPDMVFTANAGLVIGRRVILSHFRHRERQGEAPHFREWFEARGYEVVTLPERFLFEGEGDALFAGDVLYCGYRFRSDVHAHQWIAGLLGCLVISLELRDDRFYHLDTCFCPLPDGGAIWYPAAFDGYAQGAIRHHLDPLIEVPPEEAIHFACNAVIAGRQVFLAEGCPTLTRALRERGYPCSELPMTEFIKAGGACKCLTLFLSRDTAAQDRGV
jgi:N-dimethylarginine dimethylaminohydrolase